MSNHLISTGSLPDFKVGERRGVPIYKANPSLVGLTGRLKDQPSQFSNTNKTMLVENEIGEITGVGTVAFVERKTVDTEQFVKIYLDGLDGLFDLTKSSKTVFKLVWLQVQTQKDNDKVELNSYIAEEYGIKMSARTISRGIKQLLEKSFLFNSPTAGIYFYNARYMFNGSRIIAAKQYVLSTGVSEKDFIQPTQKTEQV